MPFDNPPRTPFGDIELLWDARSRILTKDHWTQGQFEDGDRHCLLGALSLVSGSPSFAFPAVMQINNRARRLLYNGTWTSGRNTSPAPMRRQPGATRS
jgi:hypothetical protein